MTTIIDDVQAMKESVLVLNFAFTDEDAAAVIPTAITWSLLDTDGNYINERQDVVVPAMAASIDILLQGDDLAFQDGETSETVARWLVVKALYDSDLGTDLPLIDDAVFVIKDNKKAA